MERIGRVWHWLAHFWRRAGEDEGQCSAVSRFVLFLARGLGRVMGWAFVFIVPPPYYARDCALAVGLAHGNGKIGVFEQGMGGRFLFLGFWVLRATQVQTRLNDLSFVHLGYCGIVA